MLTLGQLNEHVKRLIAEHGSGIHVYLDTRDEDTPPAQTVSAFEPKKEGVEGFGEEIIVPIGS